MYLVAIVDWYSRTVVSWALDQTLEIPLSWKPWTTPSYALCQSSSTATREAISQAKSTWTAFFQGIFRSAWMEKVGASTIFLPSDSGEASNTRRFTSTNTALRVSPETGSIAFSSSTNTNDLINRWAIGLPRRSTRALGGIV